MQDIIADDGFAGAGGWDLGARALGIEARGIEIMPAARATREAAGLVTIHDDVWTYTPDGKAELRIDSPPCQTFSAAGHGSGRKALAAVLAAIESGAWRNLDDLREAAAQFGDDRTGLVLTPLHFAIMHENYRHLAWEQVVPVLPVWNACAAVLADHGFEVATGVVSAEQHGVPQTRRRAVLVASRDHAVRLPVPTHSRFYTKTPERLDPGVLKWLSMADVLGRGLTERPSPTVTGGGTATGGAEPIGHFSRWATRPDWLESNYSGNQVGEDGRRELATFDLNRPAPTITSKPHKWVKMGDVRSSKGCVRDLEHPAPTMTGSMDNGNFRFVDGEKVTKRVTVEEAGVLQTFPPDFPWQGNKGDQYLQAGNAVPPLLAKAILAEAVGR